MCSYIKETGGLLKFYDEINRDEECLTYDEDDSDAEYKEFSEHYSNSEHELEDINIESESRITVIEIEKDGMEWKSTCPPKNMRTRSCNIITHLPGSRGKAHTVKTPQECWDYLQMTI